MAIGRRPDQNNDMYPGQDYFDDPTQLPGYEDPLPKDPGDQGTDPDSGGQGITDPNVRAVDPNNPPGQTLSNPTVSTTGKPSGGDINDPNYLNQLLAYYGQQPGVNPSVTNDPGYWRQAVASGRFNGDENYLTQRFMQPEGAPEGAGAAADGGGGSGLRDLLTRLLSNGKPSGASPQRDALYSRLSALMDKYSAPVTANDPEIHNASDAYQGESQRSLANFREMAAERAHAQGVPTGAFDAQIGNAQQATGRDNARFTTDLINRETQSRRSALAGVLGQGASVLDSADNTDFRNRGLDLSSLLGQEGVDNQGRSIDNQDTQFYDNLTSNMSSHANDLDTIMQELLLQRR